MQVDAVRSLQGREEVVANSIPLKCAPEPSSQIPYPLLPSIAPKSVALPPRRLRSQESVPHVSTPRVQLDHSTRNLVAPQHEEPASPNSETDLWSPTESFDSSVNAYSPTFCPSPGLYYPSTESIVDVEPEEYQQMTPLGSHSGLVSPSLSPNVAYSPVADLPPPYTPVWQPRPYLSGHNRVFTEYKNLAQIPISYTSAPGSRYTSHPGQPVYIPTPTVAPPAISTYPHYMLFGTSESYAYFMPESSQQTLVARGIKEERKEPDPYEWLDNDYITAQERGISG